MVRSRPPRAMLALVMRPPALLAPAMTALVVALVAVAAWLLTRKRSARLASVALAVGALLVVGSFVPWPRYADSNELSGRFGGNVSFAVVGSGVVDVTQNGSGAIEHGMLALSCPARCDFRVVGARLAEAEPLVSVEGGPLLLESAGLACGVVPFTLRAFVRSECAGCGSTEFVVAEGARGELRLSPSSILVC